MNNFNMKSEQQEYDFTMNEFPHNQSLQSGSCFTTSQDPVLKCELPQWDIKPDPDLQPKQDISSDLCLISEPASTLNLFSQHDIHHQGKKGNT